MTIVEKLNPLGPGSYDYKTIKGEKQDKCVLKWANTAKVH